MATYKVQQKATIWYQTEVEASSAVEAIQMVAEGAGEDWEQLLETADFQQEFWTEETGETDGEGNSLHPEDEEIA
ncbi:hypothetical protein UFOVP325_44 [uncultured Caudovirales phage]|jgi:hypothetical protein|uniref:Uncharacterized protein n=1 Tax=uncultured Caudovirales phage TaxID=2100421 RepID=A0A6J5MNN4_9CAUD|nr:hypothetical protein UFOVP325_44 [uncultured Caudovirales phage]CAB4147671.1 hypothetical protein UFOVP430_39 [uncultured Caudovirales phage]